MSNKSLLIKLICLFLFFILLSGSCSRRAEKKHILIIHSYEANFPAYKEMKEILADRLQKKGVRAEIYSYYLDCEQNLEKKQKANLFEKLNKLSDWQPDIIMTFDDQALNTLLTCNHPCIDTIPVVFSGVNYPNVPFIQKHPNITGFHDKPDYNTNLKLIERLIGKCIVVRVTDKRHGTGTYRCTEESGRVGPDEIGLSGKWQPISFYKKASFPIPAINRSVSELLQLQQEAGCGPSSAPFGAPVRKLVYRSLIAYMCPRGVK